LKCLFWRFIVLSFCSLLILGCGAKPPVDQGSLSASSVDQTNLRNHIQHVIVIVQENRSFDNLFSGFPGADAAIVGNDYGKIIPLQPVPFEEPTDVDHSHPGWWADWDGGKNDGFAHTGSYPIANMPYAYVPHNETVPYWTLASQYALADRMFQSNTGPSFVAHQYLIAGQSDDADEVPDSTTHAWGCDSPSGTTVDLIGPNGTDLPGPFHASITRR
jgi:phospholipase C